ncbi:uncharacterized protein LOC128861363 [Anastrepha ludens]|uniref:uncharacterized protein LOC128861363 n=1 Tax=Anastrepha ludens TaxID=28586 RepID=UPI0023AF72BD|nr:uncharacterized protein LOC128861363 [Anastrepha ludens]
MNGMCFPNVQGSCGEGEILANGKCCTRHCIESCVGWLPCDCCKVSLTIVPKILEEAKVARCPPMICAPQMKCLPLYPSFAIVPTIPPCYPVSTNVSTGSTTTQLSNHTPQPQTDTTPSTPTKENILPPSHLKNCPAGTIEVGGVCRLMYCGKGIFQNKRCIQMVCPAGTVWTGIKCEPPGPVTHSLEFHNSVHVYLNHSDNGVIINNVNNFTFNNAFQLTSADNLRTPSSDDISNCSNNTVPATAKCCNVFTPRICRKDNIRGRWKCYSRRYVRCGAFCIAPTIYLKPSRPRQVDTYLVMPPGNGFEYCRQLKNCSDSADPYDCSGCSVGYRKTCSSYCYRTTCLARACSFYDQQDFCSIASGGPGCQAEDGCLDYWCSAELKIY